MEFWVLIVVNSLKGKIQNNWHHSQVWSREGVWSCQMRFCWLYVGENGVWFYFKWRTWILECLLCFILSAASKCFPRLFSACRGKEIHCRHSSSLLQQKPWVFLWLRQRTWVSKAKRRDFCHSFAIFWWNYLILLGKVWRGVDDKAHFEMLWSSVRSYNQFGWKYNG